MPSLAERDGERERKRERKRERERVQSFEADVGEGEQNGQGSRGQKGDRA